MTPDKIITALTRIEGLLTGLRPERARTDIGGLVLPTKTHLKHVLWMVQEAKLFAHDMPDKAERWLCFAQGVMWTATDSTIDEFKDDNRSEV